MARVAADSAFLGVRDVSGTAKRERVGIHPEEKLRALLEIGRDLGGTFHAVVWETHKLLRRLIPGNIDLVPGLDPNLSPVKVDPAQIQQILINLVVNARTPCRRAAKW